MELIVHFNPRELSDQALNAQLWATVDVEDLLYSQIHAQLYAEVQARVKRVPGASVLRLEVSQELLENLVEYAAIIAHVGKVFATTTPDPAAVLDSEDVRLIALMHLRVVEALIPLLPPEEKGEPSEK